MKPSDRDIEFIEFSKTDRDIEYARFMQKDRERSMRKSGIPPRRFFPPATRLAPAVLPDGCVCGNHDTAFDQVCEACGRVRRHHG